MRKHYIRRLRSEVEVGSKRRLSFDFLLKALFLVIVVLTLLVALIYISTFTGYENKLVSDVSALPGEYKQATVILDNYPDNDNLLLGFLDRAYEARKFTNVTIFSISEREEDDLKSIIKIFPSNRIEFDLDQENLIQIRKTLNEKLLDKKTVIVANPDIAIRSANLCNNMGVLAIPATIEDPEYLVYTTSIRVRLEELFKITFNQLENP